MIRLRHKNIIKRSFKLYSDILNTLCPRNPSFNIGGTYCRHSCAYYRKTILHKNKGFGEVKCAWKRSYNIFYYAIDYNHRIFESPCKPKKAFAENYYELPKEYNYPKGLTQNKMDRIALEIETSGKPLEFKIVDN